MRFSASAPPPARPLDTALVSYRNYKRRTSGCEGVGEVLQCRLVDRGGELAGEFCVEAPFIVALELLRLYWGAPGAAQNPEGTKLA